MPRARGTSNDATDATDPRHALGRDAEAAVARRLTERGFVILARNARVGLLELDLVARRGALVVFCEVRARRSDAFMQPWQSMDARKLQRTRVAAAAWLRARGLYGRVDVRFDVASVVVRDGDLELRYFERAFV